MSISQYVYKKVFIVVKDQEITEMIETIGYVNHVSMLINARRFRSTNTLVILIFQNAVEKVCHFE